MGCSRQTTTSCIGFRSADYHLETGNSRPGRGGRSTVSHEPSAVGGRLTPHPAPRQESFVPSPELGEGAGQDTHARTARFDAILSSAITSALKAWLAAALNSRLSAQVNATLAAGLNQALTAALKSRVYAVLAATLRARLDAAFDPAFVAELKGGPNP